MANFLNKASRTNDLDTYYEILKKLENPDLDISEYLVPYNQGCYKGMTALMYDAINGRTNLLDILIKRYHDSNNRYIGIKKYINLKNTGGQSALLLAIRNRKNIFYEKYFDENNHDILDDGMKLSLNYALDNNLTDLVEYFVMAGMSIEKLDKKLVLKNNNFLLIQKFRMENIMEEQKELKNQILLLQDRIKYHPGNEGYLEAKAHFESFSL